MLERTLILLKPDAAERRLMGEIIRRFEVKGLRIAAMKMIRFDEALVERHYAEHIEKPFYPALKQFIMSGPCVAMVIEGQDVIAVTRRMMGATIFTEAEPGSIRGDFAFSITENLVHGSDSPERAAIEIPLFFTEDEIH